MLRCDLHVHTCYSRDGESSVEDVLMMAKKAGLDAIAITDHDTVDGVIHAQELATDIIVLPGIEISTRQGHLIALGVTEMIPAGLDFSETVALARARGAVLILPHPYHQWRHGAALRIPDAIDEVDAVETFNSRYITGSANRKAAQEALSRNKPCVGGSDAHNARFVGYGLTFVDADRDPASILQAIREGRTKAGGRMTPLRTYTSQSLKGTVRKISKRVKE